MALFEFKSNRGKIDTELEEAIHNALELVGKYDPPNLPNSGVCIIKKRMRTNRKISAIMEGNITQRR